MSKHINSSMETHYQKYKETIKRVARRNYQKRVAWLNNHLGNESCVHCGESETVCLKLYPHDTEIRKQAKRVGRGFHFPKIIAAKAIYPLPADISLPNPAP